MLVILFFGRRSSDASSLADGRRLGERSVDKSWLDVGSPTRNDHLFLLFFATSVRCDFSVVPSRFRRRLVCRSMEHFRSTSCSSVAKMKEAKKTRGRARKRTHDEEERKWIETTRNGSTGGGNGEESGQRSVRQRHKVIVHAIQMIA